MQRILELHVFVGRIGLRVPRETHDEIRYRLGVDWKIAAQALLVTQPRVVDEARQKLPGAVGIAGETPHHRTVCYMWEGCYAHTSRTQQRRLQPDLAGHRGILLFRRA